MGSRIVWRLARHDGEPVEAQVWLTPTSVLVGGDPVVTVLPRPVHRHVRDGVLDVEVTATDDPAYQPEGWVWRVSTDLRGVPEFHVEAPEGVTVDLSTAQRLVAPPVVPVPGGGGEPGRDGVGVESITQPTPGSMVVTLSDGSATTLLLPAGEPGRPGRDGVDSTVPGPPGPAGRDGADSTVPGPQGRGIVSVTDSDGDGTATVAYTDGATTALPLPRGPKGDQGQASTVPGPAGRGVTSIADPSKSGTATITYTDGATSLLPLPAGPAGPAATAQDTGWRTLKDQAWIKKIFPAWDSTKDQWAYRIRDMTITWWVQIRGADVPANPWADSGAVPADVAALMGSGPLRFDMTLGSRDSATGHLWFNGVAVMRSSPAMSVAYYPQGIASYPLTTVPGNPPGSLIV